MKLKKYYLLLCVSVINNIEEANLGHCIAHILNKLRFAFRRDKLRKINDSKVCEVHWNDIL